jgi:protoporphyrinogen oxidase
VTRYDVIIVGAGISGLSLAHYCAKGGLKTLVLEAGPRPGGTLHSQEFPGGFWLELGAHTCYNSYGNLIGIMEETGIKGLMLGREKAGFKVLAGGKLKSIPSQIHFMELLLSAPRFFTARKEGSTVKSYYSSIAGRGNYGRVLGPAFNAVLSQEADDFPAHMLFNRRPRRKDIMRSFTLDCGLQSIPCTIASEQGIGVRTGCKAKEADFAGGMFTVRAGASESFLSSALAVATPPDEAARLLSGAFPALAEKLRAIKVRDIETMGIAAKKEDIALPPVAGIVAPGDIFYSAVSRDTVKHNEYRGFSFHFKPGAGHEDRLARICEVLGLERGKVEHVVEKTNRVPSLSPGHEKLVSELDGLLEGKPLLLTGNYFTGLSLEDCVTRSLMESERLKALLG